MSRKGSQIRTPRFSERGVFDIERLSTDSMKEHFRNVAARVAEASESFVSGYAPQGFKGVVRCRYVDTPIFNAAAWHDGDDIVVGLGASVIPLLTLLFAGMLSDSEVLPSLPTVANQDEKSRWKATFILDPRSPHEVVPIEHALTAERMAAASVLADLCVSFIFLHEIGHVACGHVGAIHSLLGEAALVECVEEHKGRVRLKAMRQYWEYQADAVAASLMLQYVDKLLGHAKGKHAWLRMLAPDASEDELGVHISALASMAVGVMFIYLEGCRLEVKAEAFHPHPVVRTLYIKNIIATKVAERWGCEAGDVGELQFEYLDPFLRSLERIGLGSVDDWHDDVFGKMVRKSVRITRGGELRDMARQWSWLPVDSWGK